MYSNSKRTNDTAAVNVEYESHLINVSKINTQQKYPQLLAH